MKYLSSNIDSKDIIAALSKITGTEIWNATYQVAIDTLSKEGFYAYVEPFETMSTNDHVAWYPHYTHIVESKDGTCILYHYDGMSSFSRWEDAMDSVILSAAQECIGHKTGQIVTVLKETAEKAYKDLVNKKSSTVHDRHNQEHPFYARHSEDDPYPFE